MLKLREQHAPPPINRPHLGTVDGLENCTAEDMREHYAALATPGGAVIGVAGDIDQDEVVARLGDVFGDWTGETPDPTWDASAAPRGYRHTEQQTNQTHIAVAYEGPAEREHEATLERLATAVLSGGMSGRLFAEVREKRGLCYAVQASFNTTKAYGRTTAYVGTTPDRAQESLDVLMGELRRLGSGDGAVTPEEFRRAKTGLKSRLVMSGESTRARAGALASDVYRLGTPRSLDDIAAQIDAVELDELNAYLAERGLGEVTIASVGPSPLSLE
jgi:predicted Zn-dependent peptidase